MTKKKKISIDIETQGIHPVHTTTFIRKLSGKPMNMVEMNQALFGYGDPDYPPINTKDLSTMWESLRPKLPENAGRIIITSTPHGANHFHDLWMKNVVNKIK